MNAAVVIFRHAMARQAWNLFGWAAPLFLLGFFVIPLYDVVAANAESLLKIIEGLPRQLLAFIGGLEAARKVMTPEGFLELRYFTFMPVILGIYAAITGSGMIAADEERGVLDLVLAQPVGRAAIFLGRFAALIAGILVILFVGWLGLWIGVLRAEKLDFSPGDLALPCVSILVVTILYTTLALLLSALLPTRTSAAMFVGVYAFAGYLVTTLSRSIAGLETVARFSVQSYFEGDIGAGFRASPLLGLMAVAMIFAALAWLAFRDADIRVAGEGGWRWPFRFRS
ncbi:MAG: ABC transporter permease subunit [Verrucomicrobiota bacterium]